MVPSFGYYTPTNNYPQWIPPPTYYPNPVFLNQWYYRSQMIAQQQRYNCCWAPAGPPVLTPGVVPSSANNNAANPAIQYTTVVPSSLSPPPPPDHLYYSRATTTSSSTPSTRSTTSRPRVTKKKKKKKTKRPKTYKKWSNAVWRRNLHDYYVLVTTEGTYMSISRYIKEVVCEEESSRTKFNRIWNRLGLGEYAKEKVSFNDRRIQKAMDQNFPLSKSLSRSRRVSLNPVF